MKEIIKVEIKRIIKIRHFLILMGIILIYSIFSTVNAFNQYHVYDSSDQRILSSWDNIRESKKHSNLLDKQRIHDTVNRKDTSPHLYSRIVSVLIAANYDVYVEDLTDEEIDDFYNRWEEKAVTNFIGLSPDRDIKAMESMVASLPTPIQLGYAEGWKNVNERMIDIVTLLVLATPFLVIPLFGKDPKTNMTDLYTATKRGKKELVISRIIAGFSIGSILYVATISIFSLCKFLLFGFQGANLPIQSSLNYFFSPYNLTYLQQFLWNIVIGWAAMFVLIALALLVSVLSKKILSAALVVLFFIAIMLLMPQSLEFNYYVGNFLPYEMTNFAHYYSRPYIYTIFGSTIPLYHLVIIVSTIVVTILTALTTIVSLKYLKRPLK